MLTNLTNLDTAS